MSDPGWTRIAPGVYDDGAGGMHIVIEELLAGNGYADTPANRATLLAVIREQFPGAVEAAEPLYVCPRCGAVSHNVNDRRERYCGRCHRFEDL